MFQRILVIGPPGAGKSTFSRALRDITGLPLYYLDMINYNADGTDISKEEFDIKHSEIIQREKWIIDGTYLRTLELRLIACDTVFFLDFPIDLCLSSAEARIGQERVDLPWVATEFDDEFRQYIIDFPKEKLPRVYELVDKYKNEKKIVTFKSRKESDDFLIELSQKVSKKSQ